MIEIDQIYNEDCLEGMKRIDDGSVDCIITDLPYGTTANKWDSVIPLDKLWAEYRRIIKPACAIVLFGAEPFTSFLRMSNIDWYRYDWKWKKEQGTGRLKANYQPLRDYEDIAVFSDCPAVYCPKPMRYYPQLAKGKPYTITRSGTSNNMHKNAGGTFENEGVRYPKSVIYFPKETDYLHPTQKPVDLLRYLIRTYTDTDNLVLDSCMGSGTTAIACIKEHRHFLGFELNKEYFDIAQRRIALERSQPTLDFGDG